MKASKIIVIVSVFIILAAVVRQVVISIKNAANGDNYVETSVEAQLPPEQDIASDWKTFRSTGEPTYEQYEVRYPPDWELFEGGFWTVDSQGHLDKKIITIARGFIPESHPKWPKTRYSSADQETISIFPWSSIKGYGDISYDIVLSNKDKTPKTLRQFELMAASFKFPDY